VDEFDAISVNSEIEFIMCCAFRYYAKVQAAIKPDYEGSSSGSSTWATERAAGSLLAELERSLSEGLRVQITKKLVKGKGKSC